jgi:hypothetical protein
VASFSVVTWVGEDSESAVTSRELSRHPFLIEIARVQWEWWEGKSEMSEQTSGDEQQRPG